MKKKNYILLLLLIVSLSIFIYLKASSDQRVLNDNDYTYNGEEKLFVNGIISNINVVNEDLLILSLMTEKGKLEIIVNSDTYIGNCTKSPPKQMSYLKVDMEIDVCYFKKNTKLIASSINEMWKKPQDS